MINSPYKAIKFLSVLAAVLVSLSSLSVLAEEVNNGNGESSQQKGSSTDGATGTVPDWVAEALEQEEGKSVIVSGSSPEDLAGRFSLEESVAYALVHNHQLRESKEKLTESYGNFLTERFLSLPEIVSSSEVLKIDEERIPSIEGNSFGTDESWVARLGVRQRLFTGGEISGRRDRARLGQEFARHGYEAVRQGVVFQVRSQFYQVLLADSEVGVRRQSVELLQEELRLERNRRRAGAVSDFNVIRAEAELSNANTPLIRARNELRISLEELGRLMGLSHAEVTSVASSIQVVGELKDIPVTLNLPQAIAQADTARPDLIQLEVQKQAAAEGIQIARAGFWPQLAVQGGYGVESSRFSSTSDDALHGWEVGAELSWRIFDSYGTRGRVIQAESLERQAGIQYAKKSEEVRIEVRRALSRVVEAKELVAAARKAVKQAEESFRLAKARSDVGASPQIDLLNAQVALTQARTNQVQALYTLNVSVAELDYVTGTKVEELGFGEKIESKNQ